MDEITPRQAVVSALRKPAARMRGVLLGLALLVGSLPGDSRAVTTAASPNQRLSILEVRDKNPIASLRDYRRVVIEVEDRIVELDSIQK